MTAKTCQTRLGFEIEMLITDGYLPKNIGIDLGAELLTQHYLHIKGRGYFPTQIWLLSLIDQAKAIATATATATVAGEGEGELTEVEKLAAVAVQTFAKADPLNLQIIKYVIDDRPVTSKYFCKMIGVHTGTMAARLHHLGIAAKPGRTEFLRDRLIRILQVNFVILGGDRKVA